MRQLRETNRMTPAVSDDVFASGRRTVKRVREISVDVTRAPPTGLGRRVFHAYKQYYVLIFINFLNDYVYFALFFFEHYTRIHIEHMGLTHKWH